MATTTFPLTATKPTGIFTTVENLDTLTIQDTMQPELSEDQQLILDVLTNEPTMDDRRRIVETLSRPERDVLAIIVRDQLITDPELAQQAAELSVNVKMADAPETKPAADTKKEAVKKEKTEPTPVVADITAAQRAKFGAMYEVFLKSSDTDRRKTIANMTPDDRDAFVKFLDELRKNKKITGTMASNSVSTASIVRASKKNGGTVKTSKTGDPDAYLAGTGTFVDNGGSATSAKGYRFEIMDAGVISDQMLSQLKVDLNKAIANNDLVGYLESIAAMPGRVVTRVPSNSKPGARRTSPTMSLNPALLAYMKQCGFKQAVPAAFIFKPAPPTAAAPDGTGAFPGGTFVIKLR